jgi:hypothetical protein
MAGLLDRQGVVGLLGPTLDPIADPDGFDRRAFGDLIALRPQLAGMPHLDEMPPYRIVEDANGTRHLVRREPLDRSPPVRLAGPGILPMIDAGGPLRVAGLPMLGDDDASTKATRPRYLAQAAPSAPQERAPNSPPAAASDDTDNVSPAQPPQVAAQAAASPGGPSTARPAAAATTGEVGPDRTISRQGHHRLIDRHE